ncbi:hypothetical protein GO998_23205 (plasmid) [Ralstonia syzygii]|uniref:Transmembrane protein n=1 Tax=Ralstonia syzygii TaxID=28097 RepID=A0ABX7ZN33_9RALS|nr:hypothetical protein [Ralstonia syzygii]QUP56570.1 hypothetical protein GO998_23205 [Ralstonia syzygii]
MKDQSPILFEDLWFTANWAVFFVSLVAMLLSSKAHGHFFHISCAFFGMALASIAAHAIHSGYFAIRDAVYSRRDEPGSFWIGVASFIFFGLVFIRMAIA